MNSEFYIDFVGVCPKGSTEWEWNGNGCFLGDDWNDWVVSSLILERVSGVELLASRGGLSI